MSDEMNRKDLERICMLHSRLITKARDYERAAIRFEDVEPDMSDFYGDMGSEARREADALVALIHAAGADIVTPEPGQLQLWSDGKP